MPIASRTLAKTISRRGVLGTAAALAATPAFADCQIGLLAHDKGPRVWMDLDQVELDAAYDQSVYAPLIRQILKRYASSSNETRIRLGEPKRLPLRTDRDRGARSIFRQSSERAGLRVRARRRLAERCGQGLRLSSRALCQRRRKLHRA